MALIRTGGGAASVINLGELTFSQMSEPTGDNSYHRASVNTGVTGYENIAIVSSSNFLTYGSGGNGCQVGSFNISIDKTTGIASIYVASGFVVAPANLQPKITVVVW